MTQWHGFICEEASFEGCRTWVVFPKTRGNGKLAVKTQYWDAFPEAIELPLLEAGYMLCGIQNRTRFGTGEDIGRLAGFVRLVVKKYGLEGRCVPVGMSCGGISAVKLAAVCPELVSCLYLDAPVVNYMSWPCGFGVGQGVSGDYAEILRALSLESLSELLAYRDMPLDKISALVESRIPVVLVAGDSDQAVPFCENGIFLQRAYETAGLPLAVYLKPGCGHHPHGLEDPKPALQFVLEHS